MRYFILFLLLLPLAGCSGTDSDPAEPAGTTDSQSIQMEFGDTNVALKDGDLWLMYFESSAVLQGESDSEKVVLQVMLENPAGFEIKAPTTLKFKPSESVLTVNGKETRFKSGELKLDNTMPVSGEELCEGSFEAELASGEKVKARFKCAFMAEP